MMYFEIKEPYYALIKANSGEDATRKYIEEVVGFESDFEYLLEDCELVHEYYAAIKATMALGRDDRLREFEEIMSLFNSSSEELLIIDGCLL